MAGVLGRSVEEFLALRPEEVGMLILADFQGLPPSDRATLHSWNYTQRIKLAARDAGAAEEIANQVGAVTLEGWQWLRTHGFLAPHPEHATEWEALTRAGQAVSPQAHLDEIRGLGILRRADLDGELRRTVESLMMSGKYDDAVLAAMRYVEDRVRFAGHLSNSDIGVSLMRTAFGGAGSLRDPKIDGGEATGRMDLFAGAIGVFKNPASHRIVGNDQTQAVEVIFFANTLLRLVAVAEQATRKRGRPRKRP